MCAVLLVPSVHPSGVSQWIVLALLERWEREGNDTSLNDVSSNDTEDLVTFAPFSAFCAQWSMFSVAKTSLS